MDPRPQDECLTFEGGGCSVDLAETSRPCVSDTGRGETAAETADTASHEIEGGGCACDTSAPSAPLGLLLGIVALLRRYGPALAVVLWPEISAAVDAQQIQVAEGGDFASQVEGELGPAWATHAALSVDYASNLIVTSDGDAREPYLAQAITTEVGVALNLSRIARVAVTAPSHFLVVLDEELAPYVPGDVGLRVTIPLTRARAAVQSSWSTQIDLPRGGSAAFLGDPGAVAATLAVQAPLGSLDGSANARLRLQRTEILPGLEWGNRFEYGLALRRDLLPSVDGTAELLGSVPLGGAKSAASYPLEALGTVRVRLAEGLALRGGGGAGVGRGLGSPAWRGLAVLEVGGNAPRDTDADGLVDLRDACRHRPEDPDRHADWDGCPDPDNDDDGYVDVEDRCPDVAEVWNAYEDADGCPDELSTLVLRVVSQDRGTLELAAVLFDGRALGLLEGEGWTHVVEPGVYPVRVKAEGHREVSRDLDLRPGGHHEVELELVPEVWGTAELRLSDPAGAPIAGTVEVGGGVREVPPAGTSFPLLSGPAELHASAEGYSPRRVVVRVPAAGTVAVDITLAPMAIWVDDDDVTLRDELHFDLDSAALRPEAGPPLDELAAWLLANPGVELLRIEGHADELGTPRYNYELSQLRAAAIRDGLVTRGVAPERLEPLGTGEAALREGESQASRRVSFLVVVWADPLMGADRPETMK
jgi:outer membrane protein OmpA-like peptidoglycan-associated protein